MEFDIRIVMVKYDFTGIVEQCPTDWRQNINEIPRSNKK